MGPLAHQMRTGELLRYLGWHEQVKLGAIEYRRVHREKWMSDETMLCRSREEALLWGIPGSEHWKTR